MAQRTFSDWLTSYLAFRARAAKLLGQRLPSDLAGLQHESQELEPLRWEAEEAAALAESYYQTAKVAEAERLVAQGFAKGLAWEAAKARCTRELWARLNSVAVVKTVDSRSMKVAQHLKLLAPS